MDLDILKLGRSTKTLTSALLDANLPPERKKESNILLNKLKANKSDGNETERFLELLQAQTDKKGNDIECDSLSNPIYPKQFFVMILSNAEVFKKYDISLNNKFKEQFQLLVTKLTPPSTALTGDVIIVNGGIVAPGAKTIDLDFLEQEQSIVDYLFIPWMHTLGDPTRREIIKSDLDILLWDSKYERPIQSYKFHNITPQSVTHIMLSHEEAKDLTRTVTFHFERFTYSAEKIKRINITEDQKAKQNAESLSASHTESSDSKKAENDTIKLVEKLKQNSPKVTTQINSSRMNSLGI